MLALSSELVSLSNRIHAVYQQARDAGRREVAGELLMIGAQCAALISMALREEMAERAVES